MTALQLAVASAVAAGATRLEAAAVVTEASTLDGAGHAAVRDLAADAPVHVAAPDGSLLGTVTLSDRGKSPGSVPRRTVRAVPPAEGRCSQR